MKQELQFLIFNKNIEAKWDERLDLDMVVLSKDTCMLGLCKLSRLKRNNRKLISMIKKNIIYKKEKITLYLDSRLLDKLVCYNDFPFIFKQEVLGCDLIKDTFKLLNKRRRIKEIKTKSINTILRDLSISHKGHGKLVYGNKR